MPEITALGSSRQPHFSSGLGGKQTRGFSEQKVAPVSKRDQRIGPPELLIPGASQVLLGWELVWGSRGTFSPNCPESLTPGAYNSGASLYFSVFLHNQTGSQGQLRCLRVTSLEMPLLSTIIASSSLFTWVTLGIFLFKLIHDSFHSHHYSLSLLFGSFLPLFFLLIFSTIIYCLSQLQQFF